MSTDFRLYHGNDLEVLADVLARQLAEPAPGQALLTPEVVLIPQPAMRRWLQKHLAEAHGIAANLRFLAPGEFVREALNANLPHAETPALGDAEHLRWRLWTILSDARAMREPVFRELRPVLGRGDDPLPAWTLAGELAAAFEKYQAWRRDWLRHWDHGGDRQDWQAELWRRASAGRSHRGKRLDAYLARFDGEASEIPHGLPARVFAFACQNVSPDVLRVIGSSARSGSLHFFFLSPVQGWWGDLETVRERLRADPASVFEDSENPLLRANGEAGRDFVRTLFSFEPVQEEREVPIYVPPDPATRTGVLHDLQRDLLARRPPPRMEQNRRDFVPGSDPSLQLHACHTRLREVQVLHEQLRDLLERDPSLQARDIAVLTPDINRYAPFVQAVFGADAGRRDALPFSLADGSVIASQTAAEVFARLLELPGARFGIHEVLDLLALRPLAERLELDASDFEDLRRWLDQAGVRWGLNAEHRAELEAPADGAFSWAWALDRLLLGHAIGSDADVAGVAALPILDGGALATLDRCLQGLRLLARWQRQLAQARAPALWGEVLAKLIDDAFSARPRDAGDRKTVEALRGLVARFAEQASDAGVDAPLPAVLMRAWFKAALEEDRGLQPFLSGGISFGKMVPMRLVPFRVICLLGMNDGEFPRRDPPGSLNRLAAQLQGPQRQLGDRSIREDDRALFLQLFSAASDVFYLSYLGLDPRSGEARPPSVVVSELLDVAAQYYRQPGPSAGTTPASPRERLVVMHPLQPFSAPVLGAPMAEESEAEPRRFSYHSDWARAAAQPLADARNTPVFARSLPPPEPLQDWSSAQLLQALGNPSRCFLEARLGLHVPGREDRLAEEEPFNAGEGLDRYQLDQRVLQLSLDAPGLAREVLARRLLAEARIAPGAAGQLSLDASLERLLPALAAWQSDPPLTTQTLPYSLELGEFRLSGSLPVVQDGVLRQFSASKRHGKSLLNLGVDALVWSALGAGGRIERVMQQEGLQVLEPLPEAAARAKLLSLLRLAQRARQDVLPFMPRAGLEYAASEDMAGARKRAQASWAGEHGEGSDAWVSLTLGDRSPLEDARLRAEFAAIAFEVFGGLPDSGVPDVAPWLEARDD